MNYLTAYGLLENQADTGLVSQRLHEIAALLGMPVAKFNAADQPHLLYASENGDCWLLCSPHDQPIVRHIGNSASGQHVTDTDVLGFLMRDIGSPQHQALTTLLDQILMVHLAN